jgi:hypothetical protein
MEAAEIRGDWSADQQYVGPESVLSLRYGQSTNPIG